MVDGWLHEAVCRQRPELWLTVDYVMKIGGLYPATFVIVVTRVVVTTDATAL